MSISISLVCQRHALAHECEHHPNSMAGGGKRRMASETRRGEALLSNIFCGLRYLEMFLAAGDFGGMKDVFKGLKVLGRKFALHKINNNCIKNNIYTYKHYLQLIFE